MNLLDCTAGREVVIWTRFLPGSGLGGVVCTVPDTRLVPDNPGDNPVYPHGMVQVRLPDGVQWSCRELWIGPEYLYPGDATLS